MSESLRISWHDSNWVPHLNPSNILDYFCQKSNPFYHKMCNNEIAKMQRLSPEQMLMMTGNEFILLHVQEPILYVIRKQERLGPDSTVPLVDYYILAGVVYQAPDMHSIIQSRIQNCTLNLKAALDSFQDLCSFNPTSGYSWTTDKGNKTSTSEKTQRNDEFTRFQAKVGNLMRQFNESG